MPVDAAVVPNSPKATMQALTLTQESNMQTVRLTDFTGNAYLDREVEYYLNVFNIAPKSFKIHRPPSFTTITFAACPTGKPWALVGRVPDIVGEKWIDADSGKIQTNGIKGERFVTDLLNPSNLGTNIWQEITDEQMTWVDGGTNDLTRRGLFWSRNQEPGGTCMIHGGCGDALKCPVCQGPVYDELAMAKDRLERHYKNLLLQADQYQREGQMREIGPEHHMAGDYFHVRTPWHLVAELPSTCPNCGDAIKQGVAFHQSSVGTICVIDWKRTVASGAKKLEDVPAEFRWE